jgi:phospholipase C
VALSPNGTHAYVTDTEGNRVLVLDVKNLHAVERIPVGRSPWNVAFSHGGGEAFVTNANDNTVSVIDTSKKTVKKAIRLGSGTTTDSKTSFTQRNQIPTAIVAGPNGKIWAACNASSSLVVIDPSSRRVVRSIDLGIGDMPTAITFA